MGPKPSEPGRSAGIKAIDPDTGKTMWDTKVFQRSLANGVLATGGQLLFAALRDGNIAALDARTGSISVAIPDRRKHERIANELCGGRPAIRRDFRRQHALRFRAAGHRLNTDWTQIREPLHPDAHRRRFDGCLARRHRAEVPRGRVATSCSSKTSNARRAFQLCPPSATTRSR